MHRIVRQYCDRLTEQGAQRVFVLPYPYARGHLRVRGGQGEETFRLFPDEVLLEAAAPYLDAPLPVQGGRSDERLACATYARLLFRYRKRKMALDDPVRRLLRLCMDGDRNGGPERALAELRRLYPRYLALGLAGDLFYACSAYLSGRFS